MSSLSRRFLERGLTGYDALMSKDAYVCSFCGQPLDPSAKTTYRRAIGWVRNTGSASPLLMPESAVGWAHGVCVDYARGRAKTSPGQTDLFAS